MKENALLDPEDPQVDPATILPLFAIMHPSGFSGSGGALELRACVQTGSEQLLPAVHAALATWNALSPAIGNCERCVLAEEPPAPESGFSAFSVLLHELGHCAMGLGHINLAEDSRAPRRRRVGSCDVNQNDVCGEATSATESTNATRVLSDPATPLGDSEDIHMNDCPIAASLDTAEVDSAAAGLERTEHGSTEDSGCLLGLGCSGFPSCCPACPGAQCPSTPWQIGDLSWFRIADNNPFAVDATVIDQNSFSRNDDNLPASHNYIANANRGVADTLGFPKTQSVMYTLLEPRMWYTGLAADDVNMGKMGMTGSDRIAGNADDYTIELIFEANCASADIVVRLSDAFLGPEELATCISDYAESFPQPPLTRIHQTLRPVVVLTQLQVDLNPNITWNFGEGFLVFESDFETGGLTEWSAAVP